MNMRLIILLISVTISSSIFSQNTVYVNVPGGNEGRGILKSRGEECFVITPKHVIGDYDLDKVSIIGDKKVKSFASIEHQYKEDLAILRVEGGGTQKCTEWSVEDKFESIIDNNISGFVEYRDSDGSVQKADVEVIGVNSEEIHIQRKDAMSGFVKGWSGSSFFVNSNGQRTYLGMLYQIEGRKGYVMRADHMFNVMTSFFGKEVKEADLSSSGTDIISGNFNSSAGVLREMETKQVKLAITKFEQNNNKAIFYFTLTNMNSSVQSVEFHTHRNYLKLIDQNGISYENPEFRLGNGTDSRIELIYDVPVGCTVEFDVGMNKITKAAMLQLNGYYHVFKLFNIELSTSNNLQTNQSQVNSNKNIVLSTQTNKQIKNNVTKFEQKNNKAIFYFTLTNTNAAAMSVEFHTHGNFLKLIDQNGISYENPEFRLGNGTDNRIELIYNHPVICSVEFEVGMNKITKAAKLQLNGYYHEFIFTHLNLVSNDVEPKQNILIPSSQDSKTSSTDIGSMDLENIRLKVNKIEFVGSKIIIYYSYENLDRSNQIMKIKTHISYNKIKVGGFEFNAGYVALGSTNHEAELIYQFPVPCYAEFDIGALQPSKIESLKLGLYNFDFDFTGTGPIGTPKSLKSSKTIQERNELIESGVKLGLDLLTKKKKN